MPKARPLVGILSEFCNPASPSVTSLSANSKSQSQSANRIFLVAAAKWTAAVIEVELIKKAGDFE
jgi:hypothetical protein